MGCLRSRGAAAVSASRPLPLYHSWPLWDRALHFDLGHVLNCAVTDVMAPETVGALATHHSGLWECDLATESLIWSGGVYDIFGLQRGTGITRDIALAHYSEESRTKLGQLRAHALRHRRGFTLDVDVRAAAVGERRRMRIIAAPVCENDVAVRLHGLKLII